jgi:hypothetical protein
MQTRKCKQCTELKPINQFRRYCQTTLTGDRSESRYRYCLNCERVNNGYKHAKRTNNLQSMVEFEACYKLLIAKGGIIPGMSQKVSAYDALHETIKLAQAPKVSTDDITSWTIDEWLTKDLTQFSFDFINDYVSGPLRDKLKPILRFDQETGQEIRDTTNQDTFNQILYRMDDLE